MIYLKYDEESKRVEVHETAKDLLIGDKTMCWFEGVYLLVVGKRVYVGIQRDGESDKTILDSPLSQTFIKYV